MEKQINFTIEVENETQFQKIHEILRVKMANMELAGTLKIIDLNPPSKFISPGISVVEYD